MNFNKVIYYSLFVFLLYAGLLSCNKNSIFTQKTEAEVELSGLRILSDSIHLDNDTVYLLTEDLYRNANQVLYVEPGTLIKVVNNRDIVINSGGKIVAKGTADQPIIFTSDALKGTAGNLENFWSGIQIFGSAGSSSGELSYIRVEFSRGLKFIEVDKSTTINHIQVSYATNATAFTFTGGDSESSNLVAYASGGSDFVLNGGFTGKMQNVISYRHPLYPGTIYAPQTLAGLQITGAGTFPAISNLSVLGPDLQDGTGYQYLTNRSAAVIISDRAKLHIRNSLLSGFPNGGLYVESREAAISLQQGESDFANSLVHSNDSSRAFYIPTGLVIIPGAPPVNAALFKEFLLSPAFQNQHILSTQELQLTDPYNFDVYPNPGPQPNSPLLTGADFSGAVFSQPFFQAVTYKGAIGSENWLSGWTNFIPSQTNY